MDRRSILSGVVIVLTTPLVGCLERPTEGANGDGTGTNGDGTGANGNGTDTDDTDPARPTELQRSELTTVGDLSDVPSVDESPTITLEESTSPVTIEGTISYSSSSCGEVVLNWARYDSEDESASVRIIGRTDREAGQECTDDVVSQPYRVRLEFDEGVPASVEAIESGNLEEFTATIP
ncbi:hypothetical protein [Natronosalvus vescus]|uniref:hypothetical protein n=1 Tax=Natronosalvus vescus TaxID=2953881 RepID=UPI00209050A0|nr:hypothetical protein [Natronosalvus vescus]